MALVAALDVSAYAIEAVIKKHGGEYLKKVELFDIYQGAQVMDGYRSLAYGLTFQCDERTLTDEEVNNAFEAILAALDKELSVKLR
jgi:phenylalanyl-tRNA synthetase beta chain